MIIIARGARPRLPPRPRGVRGLPPGAPPGPPRSHARTGAAPRSAGADGRRACAGGGSDHVTRQATAGRREGGRREGAEGGAGPAAKSPEEGVQWSSLVTK
jgi:hypothetical protein